MNDRKKGTPDHDKLFRTKPLMDEIRTACQAHYHPRKELAVDERMVATKAKTGMTQYMKDKPTKWGIKLFVLAESSSGYTANFNVYSGKSSSASVQLLRQPQAVPRLGQHEIWCLRYLQGQQERVSPWKRKCPHPEV